MVLTDPMDLLDPALERMFLGIAHALFMNRLHLLRLTEVVRLGIQPSQEEGYMDIPPQLDLELNEQAINYVLTCLPEQFHDSIRRVQASWMRPA